MEQAIDTYYLFTNDLSPFPASHTKTLLVPHLCLKAGTYMPYHQKGDAKETVIRYLQSVFASKGKMEFHFIAPYFQHIYAHDTLFSSIKQQAYMNSTSSFSFSELIMKTFF